MNADTAYTANHIQKGLTLFAETSPKTVFVQLWDKDLMDITFQKYLP